MVSTVILFHWRARDASLYRPTHVSHPCVLWASRTSANLRWLILHGLALLDEADFRFGVKERKCRPILQHSLHYAEHGPAGKLEPFQNSARLAPGVLDFTDVQPTTLAYRQYLEAKWFEGNPKWTNRDRPRNWT